MSTGRSRVTQVTIDVRSKRDSQFVDLLTRGLQWRRHDARDETSTTIDVPDRTNVMLELHTEHGENDFAQFGLHIELPNSAAIERAIAVTGLPVQTREVRPAGRDIATLDVAPFNGIVGLFSSEPPYWTTPGTRCVVIAHSRSLDSDVAVLESLGWDVAHSWQRKPATGPTRRGVYLTADGAAAVVRTIAAPSRINSRSSITDVHWTDSEGRRPRLAIADAIEIAPDDSSRGPHGGDRYANADT